MLSQISFFGQREHPPVIGKQFCLPKVLLKETFSFFDLRCYKPSVDCSLPATRQRWINAVLILPRVCKEWRHVTLLCMKQEQVCLYTTLFQIFEVPLKNEGSEELVTQLKLACDCISVHRAESVSELQKINNEKQETIVSIFEQRTDKTSHACYILNNLHTAGLKEPTKILDTVAKILLTKKYSDYNHTWYSFQRTLLEDFLSRNDMVSAKRCASFFSEDGDYYEWIRSHYVRRAEYDSAVQYAYSLSFNLNYLQKTAGDLLKEKPFKIVTVLKTTQVPAFRTLVQKAQALKVFRSDCSQALGIVRQMPSGIAKAAVYEAMIKYLAQTNELKKALDQHPEDHQLHDAANSMQVINSKLLLEEDAKVAENLSSNEVIQRYLQQGDVDTAISMLYLLDDIQQVLMWPIIAKELPASDPRGYEYIENCLDLLYLVPESERFSEEDSSDCKNIYIVLLEFLISRDINLPRTMEMLEELRFRYDLSKFGKILISLSKRLIYFHQYDKAVDIIKRLPEFLISSRVELIKNAIRGIRDKKSIDQLRNIATRLKVDNPACEVIHAVLFFISKVDDKKCFYNALRFQELRFLCDNIGEISKIREFDIQYLLDLDKKTQI